MNNNDYLHYQYLKTLNEIDVDKESKINKKKILLFNEYISSNKNFKYNSTYLNDSVDAFFNVCKVFNSKKKRANKFCKLLDKMLFKNKLESNYKSVKDWYIVIDHLFLIEKEDEKGNELAIKFILNKLEEMNKSNLKNTVKNINLEKELKLFNLYNLHNTDVIKFYFDIEIDIIEFTYKFSSMNGKKEINFMLENLNKGSGNKK